MFDELWFKKHQRKLLWFLNTPIINLWFRWVFCINGEKSSVGKNKIIGIIPNAVFWKEGKKHHFEFRTHDKFSKRLYFAFKPIWQLAHWFDMSFANIYQSQWNLGFDAFPGEPIFSGSGDGFCENSNGTYATAHNATSSTSFNYSGNGATDSAVRNETTGGVYYITRCFLPFDTSALGVGATVDTATLGVWANAKDSTVNDTIRIIQTSQASTSAIESNDYDNVGTTGGGDIGTISAISTGAYTNTNLNATGEGWISVTGISKLGLRTVGDIDSTSPGNRSYIFFYLSGQTGTSNDPKLSGTYTPGRKLLALLGVG